MNTFDKPEQYSNVLKFIGSSDNIELLKLVSAMSRKQKNFTLRHVVMARDMFPSIVALIQVYHACPYTVDNHGRSLITRTILGQSAEKGKTIRYLLNNGAILTGYDDQKMSELYYAIKLNMPIILRILLDNGAYINESMSNGITPLIYACSLQHVQCIETLLEYSPQINYVDNQFNSPLLTIVKQNTTNYITQKRIIDLLLEFRADPYLQDINGHDIMYYAKSCKYLDLEIAF